MLGAEPPRLAGESSKAYGFLLEFCRMGSQRSLAELSRRFGKTPESYAFHARRWGWKDRVAAYDAAVQAADARVLHEEREYAERLRLRRELEARETYWELSRRLLAVVERMLEAAENSYKWNHASIVRLAVAAENLMRAAVEPLTGDGARPMVQGRVIAGTFRLFPHVDGDDGCDALLPQNATDPNDGSYTLPSDESMG